MAPVLASGISLWFVVVFAVLAVIGVAFAIATLRRGGLDYAARTMRGRGPYRPTISVGVGFVGIALAFVLHRFWIAVAVIAPVIVYGWWRFWRAAK